MWQKQKDKLYNQFVFKNFEQAFEFMQKVATEAKKMDHHPLWTNDYNKVEVWLTTHSEGKITDKDHQLADKVDAIFKTYDTTKTGQSMPDLKEAKLFGDGGSRGNPGPAASGVVLMDMDDIVIKNIGLFWGTATNNQAEYRSLTEGMKLALDSGVKILHVFMDSQLVINQMKGIYRVKNAELQSLYAEAKQTASQFAKVDFTHVPRELNKLADAEVNKTLDEQAKK